MLFATVGTQLPFDRLIMTLDKWSKNQKVTNNFVQIGKAGKQPQHMAFSTTLTPLQFAKRVAECKVIVSHAGMGTILTALNVGKPIIIMPRLTMYGEHRNDHQLATVENLRNRAGIHVANDVGDLMSLLDQIENLAGARVISKAAQPQLLEAVSSFINRSFEEMRHV